VERFEKEKGNHHSVSLTGGEPLFYTPFLKNFLPILKERGFATYLETNGTLYRELEQVIRWCDVIAMDMKPPSSTGDRKFWAEHEEFLKVAIRKDVFVKTVVTPSTRLDDIMECANIVERIHPGIPFIFQPLSEPFGINTEALRLVEQVFVPKVKPLLHDVRVIPQMHKIWGVR
jgi:organic radical activating enzyme